MAYFCSTFGPCGDRPTEADQRPGPHGPLLWLLWTPWLLWRPACEPGGRGPHARKPQRPQEPVAGREQGMASVALPMTFSRTRSAPPRTAAVGRTPRDRPCHPTEATRGHVPIACFCGLCGPRGFSNVLELVGILSLIGAGAARTEATEATEAGCGTAYGTASVVLPWRASGWPIHAADAAESIVEWNWGDLHLGGRIAGTPRHPRGRRGQRIRPTGRRTKTR
jgi:hypothetical protein